MRGVVLLAVLGFLLLLLIILSHGRRLDESSLQVSENGLLEVVKLDDLFLLSEAHHRGRPLYHDLSQGGKEEVLSSNFLRRNAFVPDQPLDAHTTTAENMTRVAASAAPALRSTAAPAGRAQVLTPFSLTKTHRLRTGEPLGERYHRSQFPAGYQRFQFSEGYHRSQLPVGYYRSRFPARYHRPQSPGRHHRPTHSHSGRLPTASLATRGAIINNASVTHQPIGAHKPPPLPSNASRRTSTFQRSPADPGLRRRHPETRHTDLRAKRQWAAPGVLEVVGGGLMAAATLYLARLTFAAVTLPWATHPRHTRRNQDPEVTEHMVEEAVRLWAAVEGREECRARAVCRAGGILGGLSGGSLLLVAAQRLLPREWEATVFQMAEGAILGSDCRGWRCGRDLPDDAKTSRRGPSPLRGDLSDDAKTS